MFLLNIDKNMTDEFIFIIKHFLNFLFLNSHRFMGSHKDRTEKGAENRTRHRVFPAVMWEVAA